MEEHNRQNAYFFATVKIPSLPAQCLLLLVRPRFEVGQATVAVFRMLV